MKKKQIKNYSHKKSRKLFLYHRKILHSLQLLPGMLELHPIMLFEMNGMNFTSDLDDYFDRHPLINPPPSDENFYNKRSGAREAGRNPLSEWGQYNRMRGLECPYPEESKFYEVFLHHYLPLDNSDDSEDSSDDSEDDKPPKKKRKKKK